MAITVDVKKAFEVKKKFVVNGEEYDNLHEVPEEFRGAIEQALASRTHSTTISINGKPISGPEERPARLRLIIGGLADTPENAAETTRPERDLRSRPEPAALRPEPTASIKAILVMVALAALAIWLVRELL